MTLFAGITVLQLQDGTSNANQLRELEAVLNIK